jgi:hypothetical protein
VDEKCAVLAGKDPQCRHVHCPWEPCNRAAIPAVGAEGDDHYEAEVPAQPATGPTTHPVMIESIEVKAITMINAEFITGLEAYYGKETATVNKFLSCLGDLAALDAAGKGKKLLKDHSQFAMSMAVTSSKVTVEDAMKVVNAANLNLRMNSSKNFVKHFYSKCASEISRYSNDGAMTKYWWDFAECMPSAGSPSAVGEISAACLHSRAKDSIHPPTWVIRQHARTKLLCPAALTATLSSTSTACRRSRLDQAHFSVEAWKRSCACPGMLPLFAACPKEAAP